ncbi:MAG: VOC family protein [Clostridium sp.]|nr:VOC family protein [Clostridium sp.]
MSVIDYSRYIHVGIVVHSIEKTLENMEKVFRLGSYRINPFPPQDVKPSEIQLMYAGEKGDFSARFCFIQMGNTEVELIEPVHGESVWKEFLARKGEGIHHLKYEVDSLNETIRELREKGIKCVQYGSAVGPNKGKTWAYFDTEEQLGYVLEVFNTQLGEVITEA